MNSKIPPHLRQTPVALPAAGIDPSVLQPSVVSAPHPSLDGLVPAPRRVADVIVDTLRELGVDTFYGIPGGTISPIYDALLDAPDLRVINTRHE
ncbi:MAG: hypothetical protein ACI9MR_001835, partial [Myxococcota bacterium]